MSRQTLRQSPRHLVLPGAHLEMWAPNLRPWFESSSAPSSLALVVGASARGSAPLGPFRCHGGLSTGRANRRIHGTYDVGMWSAGFVVGVVLALMGGVWALQGLNSQIVPQSFMTGSRMWVGIGTLALVSGSVLAWQSWLRR